MADIPGSEPPIIRIVKKSGGGGHHGGAWKVAYADFVTAMMAFFLVMWIVGLDKPVKQAIAAYFRDPSGFMKTTHGGKSVLGSGDGTTMKPGTPSPLIPGDGGKGGGLETTFKQAEAAIMKQIEQDPELRGLKEAVQVHLTNEGLRIELLERTSSLFFDSGSATLKPRSIHLLNVIALELARLKNPVVIEGHTDSRPLNGKNGYSNWELSADRANAARHAMELHGLPPAQVIAVRGYADRKLLHPDDPTHFSNRRVSILVAYTKAGQ